MARRITLRDVARETGFHHTTVSLALRDDPQLPTGTKDSIRAAAERLGYMPDPMLRALAAHRQSARPVGDHGVLAWLSNTKEPMWGSRRFPFEEYLAGAQRRAKELGFRIEEFVLKSPGMTPTRMSQILRTRGIQGLIVAPQPWGTPRDRLELDWEWFSAVTFGYSLEWPLLDLVTDHHMDTVKIAVRELRKLGYRRIGLYVSEEMDARANGAFVGGFIGEMMRWPKALQIPPGVYETWDDEKFHTWMRKYKPEAVIVQNTREVELAMKASGLRVPEELGLVSLNPSRRLGYACVLQNNPEIGAKAVDMLVGMMTTNRRGVPAVPCRVLIEASWGMGKTVRDLNTQ